MGSGKLDIDLFKKLMKESGSNDSNSTDEKGLRHKLVNYRKGDLNNQEVVIVALQNKVGIKNYIVPTESQLSMRTQYYWINGIKGDLEEGLMQDRLVVMEDFIEMKINGEIYQVNKNLI